MNFKDRLPKKSTEDLITTSEEQRATAEARAEVIFQSMVDLDAFDEDRLSIGHFRDGIVKQLAFEVVELDKRAKMAGVEIETFVNLNRDIVSLLASYDSSAANYPDYYQGRSHLDNEIWTPNTDLAIASAGFVRGMRIGGKADEDSRLSEFDHDDEKGLYLRRLNRKKQRELGKDINDQFNEENYGMLCQTFLDPTSYMAINAIRRVEGKELLDISTFTRFVGMKDITQYRFIHWTPEATSNDGQIEFTSLFGGKDSDVGVRFAVDKDITA